jgi:hypothetical protein
MSPLSFSVILYRKHFLFLHPPSSIYTPALSTTLRIICLQSSSSILTVDGGSKFSRMTHFFFFNQSKSMFGRFKLHGRFIVFSCSDLFPRLVLLQPFILFFCCKFAHSLLVMLFSSTYLCLPEYLVFLSLFSSINRTLRP